MSATDFETKLKLAAALELPYLDRRTGQAGAPRGRQAAVLMLFGFSGHATGPSLLITRRTERVETHKGQMAFPGGMTDPGDLDSAYTALRESEEEVGIPRDCVRVVGELPMIEAVTGFAVTPVLGLLSGACEEIALTLNDEELDEAFWVPLEVLRRPGVYRQESFRMGELSYPIHVYEVEAPGGQLRRIWGLTGFLIKNLLDRLQGVS